MKLSRCCRRCFRFIEFGPDVGPCGGLEWIEVCSWCAEREVERRAEVERLEAMWAARVCAAEDCEIVFSPSHPKQRFHDDRCRKRTHRRLKAGLAG